MSEIVSSETMSESIVSAHNYHDWVFGSFADYLRPGSALEVGSGHGRFSLRLLERVDRLIVADIDPEAIARIRESMSPSPKLSFLVMDGVDRTQLREPVDNIVLLNVLEHIQDDAGFLARCRESLAAEGRLIVFVPAFEALFARMDREAGHFRRYSRDGLKELLEREGFSIDCLRYFNAVGFAGWLVNKWLNSAVNSGSTNAQVRLYDRLIPWLKRVDDFVPWFGQSLVAVARRRD
jgi:SAM-dependent methyltransferase